MSNPSSTLSRAETMHTYFRGAMEYVKLLGYSATVVDVLAGAGSVAGILKIGDFKSRAPWLPLVGLFAVVLSTILRSYATTIRSYAQRARKVSLRALATEVDVDALTASNAEVDAPTPARRLASMLPSNGLRDYYLPRCPPGPERTRELYAHSAFFSHSLLKTYATFTGLVGLVVTAIAFSVMYAMTISPVSLDQSQSTLEVIWSVIFVLFGIRYLENAVSSNAASHSIRKVEEELLRNNDNKNLDDLTDAYDLEISSTKDVPTLLYRFRKSTLTAAWNRRRAVLDEGNNR